MYAMSPRELFSVVVRSIGLWFVILGVRTLAGALYYSFKVSFAGDIVGEFLIQAAPDFLIGLYLLSGAPALVNRCFPMQDESP